MEKYVIFSNIYYELYHEFNEDHHEYVRRGDNIILSVLQGFKARLMLSKIFFCTKMSIYWCVCVDLGWIYVQEHQ